MRSQTSSPSADGWETVPVKTAGDLRYIDHHSARYVLSDRGFEKGIAPVTGQRLGDLACRRGLQMEEALRFADILGKNTIAFKPDTVAAALGKEFCSFFYLYQFQLYLIWFWPCCA